MSFVVLDGDYRNQREINSVTVGELKEKRKEVEQALIKLVTDFFEETGLTVSQATVTANTDTIAIEPTRYSAKVDFEL